MRLEGKVAIVTGGTRGIGEGIVTLFAGEGAQVVNGDLDEPDSLPPGDVTWERLDVTDLDNWQRVVDGVVAAKGAVDVLVNNAGFVGSYEPIDSIPLDDWNRIVAVNQTGVFYGMRTVIPVMKKAGRGSIINVSSIWGVVGAPGVSAYQASKAACHVMTKNAALSYVGDGIRANSIHPGIIDTPMIAAQDPEITQAVVGMTPMGRLGTPREIAYGAVFLASDESSFITGTELVIDGGVLCA
ncbi:MAG: glucose 1-dehydrogenase [Actinomycetia bacterium]|nr:glucose 1-dehydrogenase [Actinomycetes bacterium]